MIDSAKSLGKLSIKPKYSKDLLHPHASDTEIHQTKQIRFTFLKKHSFKPETKKGTETPNLCSTKAYQMFKSRIRATQLKNMKEGNSLRNKKIYLTIEESKQSAKNHSAISSHILIPLSSQQERQREFKTVGLVGRKQRHHPPINFKVHNPYLIKLEKNQGDSHSNTINIVEANKNKGEKIEVSSQKATIEKRQSLKKYSVKCLLNIEKQMIQEKTNVIANYKKVKGKAKISQIYRRRDNWDQQINRWQTYKNNDAIKWNQLLVLPYPTGLV